MGRFGSLLVLAMLLLTPVSATVRPADDAGSIVDRWVTAFNSNDVDALVSIYAPDAILLGSTDLTHKEGSHAIRGYFVRLAKRRDRVAIDNRKVIMLRNDVAYVTGFYTFSAVRNGEVKKSLAGFSMVLVKLGGDWLHHHSSQRSSPSPSLPLQRI